jgi:hypothetical protein
MNRDGSRRTVLSHRNLFTTTSLLELGAGLSLMSLPALAVVLLLGVESPSPEALTVARVVGVALVAIGVACWFARDDRGSRSQRGLLWAMLAYNVGATAVLAVAGATLSMAGVALWPAVVLHGAMAIWCVLTLRRSTPDAQ